MSFAEIKTTWNNRLYPTNSVYEVPPASSAQSSAKQNNVVGLSTSLDGSKETEEDNGGGEEVEYDEDYVADEDVQEESKDSKEIKETRENYLKLILIYFKFHVIEVLSKKKKILFQITKQRRNQQKSMIIFTMTMTTKQRILRRQQVRNNPTVHFLHCVNPVAASSDTGINHFFFFLSFYFYN